MLHRLSWFTLVCCLLSTASWASGQAFYDLGAGRANGINDAGLIVGSKVVAPGTVMPSKWKGWDLDGKGVDGANTVLPLPSGASGGEARSVNAQGLIVGSTTDSLMHWPCKWKGWDLDSPSPLPGEGATGGVAYNVNGNGLMVGSTTDSLMRVLPCKWKGWDLDRVDPLPVFGDSTGGAALAVSSQDKIAGYILDAGGSKRAALWSPLGDGSYSVTDLNSFLPTGSGWQLESAQAINADGWIVGYGLYDGVEHGFVITPEPGTMLLGCAGGLLLMRRRRRA